MTFEDLLRQMSAAVEEELNEVRAARAGRKIAIRAGHAVGRSGSDWLYRFALEQPAEVPEEVPAELELPDGSTYSGQVTSSAMLEVTVASGSEIKADLSHAYLVLDPAFLLEKLLERLEQLEEEHCELALALLGDRAPRRDPTGEAPPFEGANPYQLSAVQLALDRDIAYIWGPPGTGKTTTLGFIAEALVRQGLRVLLVASTNIAVDNAGLRVANAIVPLPSPWERQGEGSPGAPSVVRFGTPQLAALRKERGLFDQALPLTVIPAKRERVPEEEQRRLRTLRQADVIATTLSRAYLSPEIGLFDAVLVDEVSAAPLPAVFCAAALAVRKVAVLGDPKQLPPVATGRGPLVDRWLKRDVFAEARLTDDDERSVLLREQYRMHPDISRLANQLVYGGRLIDAAHRSSGGVRLVDTSGLGGRCQRVDGSRQNELHAHRAVELAAELLREQAGSVAIITPYRAQSRLIWRALRDARLEGRVEVGTVHRFQGLERDAIIFDTVEAEPERPAPFVSGRYGSEAMRLLNVAITRAKSRLLVIADVHYLWTTLPRNAMLMGLLRMLLEETAE